MRSLVSVLLVAALSLPAMADETPSVPSGATPRDFDDLPAGDSLLQDVYVRLYLARFRKSKVQIEAAKVALAESMRRRERTETLYIQHAASAEELDIIRKEVDTKALDVQVREAEAEEAKTFLDIAVTRISLGLDMPICATLQ